jgi:mRNA-degrading endonuclease RelE of RelBE toxin-antitoxin system
MYRVEFTPGFERDIRRLDKPDALRVIEKIEWLADNPHAVRFPLKHMPGDLKDLHKYRIGPWRVFLWINHEQQVITV